MQYTVGKNQTRQYVAANNQTIDLEPYYVNFTVLINNKPFTVRNAMVMKSYPKRQIILGAPELNRHHAVLQEANGKMTIGRYEQTIVQRYSIADVGRTININNIKAKVAMVKPVEQHENDHYIERTTEATIGDSCYMGRAQHGTHYEVIDDPSDTCKGCPKCTTDENKIQDQQYHHIDDSRQALHIMCHRLRQHDHNQYTHNDVTISEAGEKLYPWTAKKIRQINEKYKCNFAKSIGDMGDEFTASCEVSGEFSKRLVGQQPHVGDKKAAIKKQLLSLLANGVLRMVDEAKITPKYFINLMPRVKKDDDGVEYNPFVALRIVNDCTQVNQLANYAGTCVDNISECVGWAAQASKNGLNAKTDISSCYYCIRLDKKLWPYMCIEIPDVGIACMVRLPQGWSFSAQYTVAVLRRILWKFDDCIRRYIDDVFISCNNSSSEKEFVELYENFMRTLKLYNLRIKGSKTFLLNIEFNFLGYRIKDGAIMANPHLVNKLLAIKWQDLKTVRQVMSLTGMARYLAKFMKRATHVMNGLNQAIRNRKPSELIDWNADLIAKFELIKKAMNELSKTYPFELDLETVVTVDTSKIATGGLIYQIKDGKPRIVAFFSRTRKDLERKFQFSSCNFEAIGACAILKSHEPWLLQTRKPITLLTDSLSLVKLWRKFKKNMCPSDDIKLNNCLMELRRYPMLNMMHASNKSAAMLHPDFVSRMEHTPKSVDTSPCVEKEGVAKCKICELAEIPIENVDKVNEKFGEISKIWAENETLGGDMAKLFQLSAEPRVPIAQLKRRNLSLADLLNNKNILATLQKMDRVYRDMIDCMENGRKNFPRKHARAETIKVNRDPKLDNGALSITKWLDGNEIRVFPIPKAAAWVVIHAVHLSVGHRSPTQMVKQVATHFEFENMKKMVELYIGKCVPCTLLRNEAKYVKKHQKPVKITDKFFKQILCDEIHRQRHGKTIKFMIAIEAISQFMVAIPIENDPKSEDFVATILLIRSMLAPHALDDPVLEIRCDGAPWHKSKKAMKLLSDMNIKVHVHESATLSQNIIPELDGKMAQFSKQMRHYMTTTDLNGDLCAQLATQKCNTTVNSRGFTPSQLFTGRNPAESKLLNIDVEKYIQEMAKIRQQKRESMDRKNYKKVQEKRDGLVKYEDPELNDPLSNSKIKFHNMKTGDMVVLNTTMDKNDQNPNLYIITKIDFRKQQVKVKRSGIQSGNNPERLVAFERIARHIKVDLNAKINLIGQHRKSSRDFGYVNVLKNTPEPEYALTDEDLDDILVVQQIIANKIPQIICAANKINDTMANESDNLHTSSSYQAVPSASLNLSKLSEDSSWTQAARAVAKNRENLKNRVETSKIEEETKKEENKTTYRMNVAEDYTVYDAADLLQEVIFDEEYEEVTSEMLSEAMASMRRLNESTVSVSSFGNDALFDVSAQILEQSRYENDQNLLNSTVMNEDQEENQVLPDIDERPIRNRKPVDRFQAGL